MKGLESEKGLAYTLTLKFILFYDIHNLLLAISTKISTRLQ